MLGGCTDPDAVRWSGLEPHSRPDTASEPQGAASTAAVPIVVTATLHAAARAHELFR